MFYNLTDWQYFYIKILNIKFEPFGLSIATIILTYIYSQNEFVKSVSHDSRSR